MNINVAPLDKVQAKQAKGLPAGLGDPIPGHLDAGVDRHRAAFVTTSNIRHTHNGKPVSRVMAVLRTVGCTWDDGVNGCTMCDFKRYAADGVGTEELTRQLSKLSLFSLIH